METSAEHRYLADPREGHVISRHLYPDELHGESPLNHTNKPFGVRRHPGEKIPHIHCELQSI